MDLSLPFFSGGEIWTEKKKKTFEEDAALQLSLLNRFASHMSRATKEGPPERQPEHCSGGIGNRQESEILNI